MDGPVLDESIDRALGRTAQGRGDMRRRHLDRRLTYPAERFEFVGVGDVRNGLAKLYFDLRFSSHFLLVFADAWAYNFLRSSDQVFNAVPSSLKAKNKS